MRKFFYKLDIEQFFIADIFLQLLLIAGSVTLGFVLQFFLQRHDKKHPSLTETPSKILLLAVFVPPLASTVLLAIAITIFTKIALPTGLLLAAQQLTFGWLAVIIIRRLTESSAAGWFSGLVILPVTLLHVVGIWPLFVKYLNSLSFDIGESKVTLYRLLSTLVVLVALLWLARSVNTNIEQRLRKSRSIRASTRALIVKMLQIFSYCIIFLFALNSAGVDLGALAVFGGALGVGLGFGFQKIASNFISGIILLFEKSIEMDDLIELSDGTTGSVRHTGARYTLIETVDGREILIPNEDFIVQRVTNWTYSNKIARVEIPISVAYESNFTRVQEILLAAAKAHPRCSKKQAPACFLRNFGESSANFVLLFWVDDVTEGRWAPQSEVMLEIWRCFQEAGIQIPYPQREYRVRGDAEAQETFPIAPVGIEKSSGKSTQKPLKMPVP